MSKVKSESDNGVIDHYQGIIPYDPSEVIIYPCKGKPALLIDAMSPMSSPVAHDYQELKSEEWGHPIVRRFIDDDRKEVNLFLSVFDEAAFDYDDGQFSTNTSTMEY